jgi:hypothetical protein
LKCLHYLLMDLKTCCFYTKKQNPAPKFGSEEKNTHLYSLIKEKHILSSTNKTTITTTTKLAQHSSDWGIKYFAGKLGILVGNPLGSPQKYKSHASSRKESLSHQSNPNSAFRAFTCCSTALAALFTTDPSCSPLSTLLSSASTSPFTVFSSFAMEDGY